jgi:CRP/FNR family transcriptional regulator, nitrogen oxide reductase regulator
LGGDDGHGVETVSWAALTGRQSAGHTLRGENTNQRIFVNSSQSTFVPMDERSVMPSSRAAVSWEDLSSRVFDGLAPPDIRVVLAAATERYFPAGEVVTTQGARADHFFVLATGRARYFFITEEGRKLILLWLPPGEIFGGAAFLPRASNYIVSTETVQPSQVLVWKRAAVRSLAARYPRLTENVLSVSSDYMSIYVATHVALTCHTARQRLGRVLANLARGFGRNASGGIELDATNEDLANAANVSHFTVSRLLSEWSRNGVLKKERGKILLRSPELLFAAAPERLKEPTLPRVKRYSR